jgi:hypothetical protein
MFKKIVNIFRKMMSNSNYSKMLLTYRFEEIIKPDAIPKKEMLFIDHIINYLYINKDKLSQGLQTAEIDHDDP